MEDRIILNEDGPFKHHVEEFQALLETVKEKIGNSRYKPNAKRIKEALHVSETVEKYFSDMDGYVVVTELMSPSLDCGHIDIIGKDVAFESELLTEINKYVDQIDVIPCEDGKLMVMLNMYNIAELTNGSF